MSVHNQRQVVRAVKGGVIAGLVSGLVLSVFLAVMNATQGRDVLRGMKFPSYPFLGERALEPGFDHVAIVTGQASHFAVSIVWGIFFGLLFFGFSKMATLVAGVFWGLIVWLGMLYVMMPILGFPAGGRGSVAMAIFEHVLFGVVLAAAFLPFQREIPSIRRPRMTPMH